MQLTWNEVIAGGKAQPLDEVLAGLSPTERERYQEYLELRTAGLSEYEARGTVWPG
jgi:hypothetical protein